MIKATQTILSFTFLACCVLVPAKAQTMSYGDIERLPAPPAGLRSAYGEGPQQFGELRLPKGRGPFPVVMLIHGGCWYSEYDLRHVGPFAAALTEAGYATWTIEYRRVGDEGGGWPGTFRDVALAADHLRALARHHPLDLKRVIAVGHSAGGELALWLAARRRLPPRSPLRTADPLRLRGVVALAGITDMRQFRPRCGDAPAKLLGGPPETFDERYRQTSPTELLPLGVPQRLIHGAQDQIVPVEHARSYEEAGKGQGEDVRLTVVEGAGHFELIAPNSSAWPSVVAALGELSGLEPRPQGQWEAEIRKFEESDRHSPPPRGAVIFVGSSSVRLWQSLAEDFPEVSVINRGFGGSQIADSTLYAGRIVVPYKPRMVVLYAGDNDLAAGKTPRQVFEDYKAFVGRIRRDLPKTKIAFISIKPSPARAALLPKMREANELIRDYSSKDKRLAYVDVFTPMLGGDGSPRPELFGPDMLHMNREGYRLWKSVLAPYLR